MLMMAKRLPGSELPIVGHDTNLEQSFLSCWFIMMSNGQGMNTGILLWKSKAQCLVKFMDGNNIPGEYFSSRLSQFSRDVFISIKLFIICQLPSQKGLFMD